MKIRCAVLRVCLVVLLPLNCRCTVRIHTTLCRLVYYRHSFYLFIFFWAIGHATFPDVQVHRHLFEAITKNNAKQYHISPLNFSVLSTVTAPPLPRDKSIVSRGSTRRLLRRYPSRIGPALLLPRHIDLDSLSHFILNSNRCPTQTQSSRLFVPLLPSLCQRPKSDTPKNNKRNVEASPSRGSNPCSSRP